MHAKLREVFEALENDRRDLLAEVNRKPELYLKSTNGKWSIAEILTHILTSERMALAYMKKKCQGIQLLDDSGWLEPLKLELLKVSQRLPIRYKAPKSIVEKTPKPLALVPLQVEWQVLRQEMGAFLDSIKDEHIRRLIFKHPLLGKFNAVQGLSFMHEHFLHHLPQVHRHLKQSHQK